MSALNWALAVLALVGAVRGQRWGQDIVPPPGGQKFTGVELQLQKRLLDTLGADRSIVFSPLSVRALLAVVREGSLEGTRADLDEALGDTRALQSLLRRQLDGFNSGNAVYLSNHFVVSEEFREAVTSKYGAEFQYTDFTRPRSAAFNINEWVRRITRKGISEIVTPDSLGQDAVFVAVNAIHLDAKWKEPFDPDNTQLGVFYEARASGQLEPRHGPIMHLYAAKRYGRVDSLKAKVLELPFSQPERHALYIVLPDDPHGLPQMINNLRPESLGDILGSLGHADQLNIYLPRFKIATGGSLKSILPPKLAALFEPSANVNGISAGQSVQLTQMLHKAVIEVDEKGVKGSAATSVQAVLLSSLPPSTFNASHPFLFFVAEQPHDQRVPSYYRQNFNPEVFFMGVVTRLDESQAISPSWGPLPQIVFPPPTPAPSVSNRRRQ